MSIVVLPAFNDIKQKSSGGGGLSDGGAHSERLSLSVSSPVEVGPPPGVAWGYGVLSGEGERAATVLGINFDPVINVEVEEYLVLADGTQKLLGSTALAAAPSTTVPALNANAVAPVSKYFDAGGVLAYPNKLRYKLALGYGQTSPPTKRVLLHFDVVEYDKPKDQ